MYGMAAQGAYAKASTFRLQRAIRQGRALVFDVRRAVEWSNVQENCLLLVD